MGFFLTKLDLILSLIMTDYVCTTSCRKFFLGTVWKHNHYGGESIIVWTGISGKGRTEIYAIDETLTFQRLNN